MFRSTIWNAGPKGSAAMASIAAAAMALMAGEEDPRVEVHHLHYKES